MKLFEMIKHIFRPAPKEIEVKQRIVVSELESENYY